MNSTSSSSLSSDKEILKNYPHNQLEAQSLLQDSDEDGTKSSTASTTLLPHLLDDERPHCSEHATDLLRWDNIAIPFCYLTVGLCQGLNRPLLNVYPLDLGATEAQQATINLVVMIPATLKILFGFLSDNYPLFGYRRKPYMLIGWMVVIAIMLTLFFSADLTISYDENGEGVAPPNAPSMEWVSLSFLIFGLGMWWADVMGDTIVAEKARMEPPSCKGQLQATCYACRFFGIMVGALVSTMLYTWYGPGTVVIAIACAPLWMVPLIYVLGEEKHVSGLSSGRQQCVEIWNTICSRAVWQPIGFIYVFNLLQVQNAAWRQYLSSVLHFTAEDLNILLVVSYVCLFTGTLCYKRFFLQASWRRVYQLCILVTGCLTALQLLLIRGHTFGLANFWFALGDDAAAEFVQGVQFLPAAILFVALCPPGSEGASYAMFTTAMNSAILLAPAISSMLLPIWDVRADTLKSGDLDGLFNLSVLTTVIQASPLLVLSWMPHSREELKQLATARAGQSVLGGAMFLLILTVSMGYTFVVGILNIVDPGWAGES